MLIRPPKKTGGEEGYDNSTATTIPCETVSAGMEDTADSTATATATVTSYIG